MRYFHDQSNLQNSDLTTQSFEQVIHRLIAQCSAIQEKQLRWELDCQDIWMPCTLSVEATLEQMLTLAAERSPAGSELLLTLVNFQGRLEIEIADSGPNEPSPMLAEIQRQFSALGQNLICQPCPQGGLAWTLVLEHSASLRQAA